MTSFLFWPIWPRRIWAMKRPWILWPIRISWRPVPRPCWVLFFWQCRTKRTLPILPAFWSWCLQAFWPTNILTVRTTMSSRRFMIIPFRRRNAARSLYTSCCRTRRPWVIWKIWKKQTPMPKRLKTFRILCSASLPKTILHCIRTPLWRLTIRLKTWSEALTTFPKTRKTALLRQRFQWTVTGVSRTLTTNISTWTKTSSLTFSERPGTKFRPISRAEWTYAAKTAFAMPTAAWKKSTARSVLMIWNFRLWNVLNCW